MTNPREAPEDPDDLYDARGDVPLARPVLHGDVFADVPLPGGFPPAGFVAIVQHPCSMRAGAVLRPRLTVARVVQHQRVTGSGWQGHVNLMPLPLLADDMHFAVDLRELTTVDSAELRRDRRIAGLSNYGITVLQQRHVHYLTRLTVDIPTLAQTFEGVAAEMELLEEWVEAALERADNPKTDPMEVVATAEAAFDTYLSNDAGRLRTGLDEAVTRADVRREVRRQIKVLREQD